jgi:hypothetical protein
VVVVAALAVVAVVVVVVVLLLPVVSSGTLLPLHVEDFRHLRHPHLKCSLCWFFGWAAACLLYLQAQASRITVVTAVTNSGC